MRNELPNANWWESFYDDWAQRVLADQSEEQISQDVSNIESALRLASGASVLDQCCGLGQHAMEFRRRGYQVTGIDQSSHYIEHAKLNSRQSGLAVRFQVADALAHVESIGVDAVFNWHSSFGYHNKDDFNLRMLKSGWKSLRPGGQMLLEFPNMLHLIQNFESTIEHQLADGMELTRTSWIDVQAGTLRQRWTYVKSNGQSTGVTKCREHESLLRLYLPDQLTRLMETAGFTGVCVHSHTGQTLTIDDARCIVVGRRPPS